MKKCQRGTGNMKEAARYRAPLVTKYRAPLVTRYRAPLVTNLWTAFPHNDTNSAIRKIQFFDTNQKPKGCSTFWL